MEGRRSCQGGIKNSYFQEGNSDSSKVRNGGDRDGTRRKGSAKAKSKTKVKARTKAGWGNPSRLLVFIRSLQPNSHNFGHLRSIKAGISVH